MKRLLGRQGAEVLARLARSRALLAFDFDGTLAPIVTDRRTARMRARTRALLAELCGLYPCAILSGRGRADVAGRLGQARVQYIIGNHGMEPGAALHGFARVIARAKASLVAALRSEPGVDIEDKRYSLSLHYRRARSRRAARTAILRALAALSPPLRIVPGKLVLNLLPAGAPDKGVALTRLRARERATVALYVGDDVTDEDVFRLGQPGRLLSVRVGRSRRSAASHYLRDQAEIDDLLARLVALRAKEPHP